MNGHIRKLLMNSVSESTHEVDRIESAVSMFSELLPDNVPVNTLLRKDYTQSTIDDGYRKLNKLTRECLWLFQRAVGEHPLDMLEKAKGNQVRSIDYPVVAKALKNTHNIENMVHYAAAIDSILGNVEFQTRLAIKAIVELMENKLNVRKAKLKYQNGCLIFNIGNHYHPTRKYNSDDGFTISKSGLNILDTVNLLSNVLILNPKMVDISKHIRIWIDGLGNHIEFKSRQRFPVATGITMILFAKQSKLELSPEIENELKIIYAQYRQVKKAAKSKTNA